MKPPPPATADPRLRSSPIAIVGIPFDSLTMQDAVDWVTAAVQSGKPHYAVTANVDFVVQALRDVELRRIIFDAHLVLCDGMPLVWASRVLGNPLPERVAGSDLMPRLLAEAESRGWRVFLLGASPESIQLAASRSRERHPRLNLVGAYSPPFKPLLEMDHADILRRVHEARPDLLFISLGCPKQEKWINLHYRRLGVPFCLGVGAAIDFLAGTLQRAPVWMQRSGTEWFYRLCQEPRRLARRYGRGFFVFGGALLAQVWQMRARAKPSPAPQRSPPPRPSPPHTTPIPAPTPPPAPGPASRPPPLAAPARLDAAAARELTTPWSQTVATDPHPAIDLGRAEFIDSTGVGLLVRLQKLATRHGHRLHLLRPQPQLLQALRLMRIEGFFNFGDPTTTPAHTPAREPAPAEAPHPASSVLTWTGEISAATRETLASEAEPLLARLEPGSTLILDLAGVTFIDSAGLGFVAGLKRNGWPREIFVACRNPSDAVRQTLRWTRLEEYLLQEPTPIPAAPPGPPPAATR